MRSGQEIAETIKCLAKAKSISVADMLESCGINKNGLFVMQNRGSIPKADNLGRIADALDCSVDYLLGRTDRVTISSTEAEELPDDEKILLERYRQLDNIGQEIVRAKAGELLQNLQRGLGAVEEKGYKGNTAQAE